MFLLYSSPVFVQSLCVLLKANTWLAITVRRPVVGLLTIVVWTVKGQELPHLGQVQFINIYFYGRLGVQHRLLNASLPLSHHFKPLVEPSCAHCVQGFLTCAFAFCPLQVVLMMTSRFKLIAHR